MMIIISTQKYNEDHDIVRLPPAPLPGLDLVNSFLLCGATRAMLSITHFI